MWSEGKEYSDYTSGIQIYFLNVSNHFTSFMDTSRDGQGPLVNISDFILYF